MACKCKEKAPKDKYIHCPCGLARVLPAGLQPGNKVSLAPCQCGAVISGIFTGDSVDEVFDESGQ